MRIISFNAEHVKKLSVVEIVPGNENLVQITGKNANGKTSVLDSIAWALESAKDIQAEPIARGWNKARIRLDLGELVVTRTFARAEEGGYTTSLTVEQDGAKLAKPQNVLDALLGALSFDPLQFTRMKPGEQFELLTAFVPDVDFKKIEKDNDADFERRTEINRRAADLRGAIELIQIPDELPEALDVTELTQQLAGAANHNTEIATRRARRLEVQRNVEKFREDGNACAERAQDKLSQANRLVQEAEAQATKWREEAERLDEESAALLTKADSELARLQKAAPLPDEIDTEALAAQIEEARAGERVQALIAERAAKVKQAEQLEASSEELTEAMAARKQHIADAVSAAKLPVDGIGFGEGEILLNGLPFGQASDAEQLKASIAIAMAMNPKLRVLRIRDGSLLDDDAMNLLRDMLKENDFQCWIERVDSSGKVGIVMENGAVKGAAAPAAAAPAKPAAAAAKPVPPKKPAAAPPARAPEPKSGNLLGDDDL